MKSTERNSSNSLAVCTLFVGVGMMIGEGLASWINQKPYTWLVAGGFMTFLGITALPRKKLGAVERVEAPRSENLEGDES
ncbi:MAG: hypothetical protein RIK87_00160 [Fuerstiella sp.]